MPKPLVLALAADTSRLLAEKLRSWLAGESQTHHCPAPCRLAICAGNNEELSALARQTLNALESGKDGEHPQIYLGVKPAEPIAWLFPGQGSQSPGMLMPLREIWPAFAHELETLDRHALEKTGHSILAAITAPDTPENAAHLQDTRQAQPALGLIETALAKAWKTSGLKADFYAGHSYGEIPALAAAGAFDDDTLILLSQRRGQLLGEAGDLAPGGMLAARSDAKTLTPLLAALHHQIYIANDNAPQQVVLAGSHEALAEAATLLQSAGIRSTPLKTACAFHSPLMAPVSSHWQDFLTRIAPRPFPAGHVYANATARPYSGLPEETRELLTRQITAPVQWREEIEALYAAGCRVFLEIGPGRVLTDLVGKILGQRPHVRLASDPGKQPAEMALARLFAQLYSLGFEVDLAAWRPAPPATTPSVSPHSPICEVTMTSAPAQPPAPEAGFFEANQQAVCAFFQQQQHIVNALGGHSDGQLFGDIVRANQAIMQDFLATQQAALQLPGGVQIPAAVLPIPGAAPIAPSTSARADAERWIVNQLAEMTGLPPTRIGRHTRFESELGIDSITLVELWVQLTERFPGLKAESDQVSHITCIDDILQRIDAVTGSAPVEVKTGAPAQGSIEHWLLNEISMLTGLPVDRLNRDTLFEADLGIDSITMVELWIKLVEQFPQFGEHTDGASKVKNVADVLKLVGADAPPEMPKTKSTLVEHPASDWLAQIRADLVARIAQETGIDPAQITGQSHFTHDLGLDVFTRERIFEEEIGRNPKLAFAGRELLNVSNLDELTKLLSRFNNLMSDKPLRINEDGKIITSDDEAERVGRYVLVGQPPVPPSELGSLPERILLIGEEGPNYAKIRDAFASCEVAIETLYLNTDCWRHPSSEKIAGLDDIDGIAAILHAIAPDGRLPAIIYLGMPDFALRGPLDDPGAWRDEVERAGVGLFAFAKAASPMLRAMGRDACVGVLTTQASSAFAAAAGVAKALTREWPKARIRTVRLIEDFDQLAPRTVLKVLTWGPSAHDLQLVRDGVIRQVLVKKPINEDIVHVRRRHPRLNKHSVILLVGGATGITAEVSVMLARHYHAHIVAVGRTPMPEAYPYQGISDDASLKRMLFDEVNRADDLNEADAAAHVKSEHARIRRQREIWTNRERVLQAGGRFSYYQVDITDTTALAKTLATIREECGAVHGLIHGAGIIDDCLIEKKTVAEFKNVYYTKAISVFNLAMGLRNDPLQFVFLFSSLASYTGTPGQTDYVAANEVINAAAKYWNAKVSYPVRSLLWSVWTESGLVASSATQRQMARLGLAGISNEQGIKLLHDELIGGDKFDDWVLLTPQSTLDYTAGGSVHAPRQEGRG